MTAARWRLRHNTDIFPSSGALWVGSWALARYRPALLASVAERNVNRHPIVTGHGLSAQRRAKHPVANDAPAIFFPGLTDEMQFPA